MEKRWRTWMDRNVVSEVGVRGIWCRGNGRKLGVSILPDCTTNCIWDDNTLHDEDETVWSYLALQHGTIFASRPELFPTDVWNENETDDRTRYCILERPSHPDLLYGSDSFPTDGWDIMCGNDIGPMHLRDESLIAYQCIYVLHVVYFFPKTSSGTSHDHKLRSLWWSILSKNSNGFRERNGKNRGGRYDSPLCFQSWNKSSFNPLKPTAIRKLLEIIGRVRLYTSCLLATALD